MKSIRMTLALTGALIAAVAYADQQQMNPNMPGMAGMAGMQHGTKTAEAHGVGVIRAIDTAQGRSRCSIRRSYRSDGPP